MSRTFEVVERVGISTVSVTEAIKTVVSEAHTERPVSWFNVVEERGRVTPEGVIEFQVTVKIGRKLS